MIKHLCTPNTQLGSNFASSNKKIVDTMAVDNSIALEIYSNIVTFQERLRKQFGASDELSFTCALYALYLTKKGISANHLYLANDISNLRRDDIALYIDLNHYIDYEPNVFDTSRALLYRLLDEFQISLSCISKEYFDDSYNTVLGMLFSGLLENSPRRASAYCLPSGIAAIFATFVNSNNVHSVYNPFAGAALLSRGGLKNEIKYLGQEIADLAYTYGRVIIDANPHNKTLLKEDSITNWRPKETDAIVSVMPWGLRVKDFDGKRYNIEDLYLKRASQQANISIGLYPMGILWRGGYTQRLRQTLINAGIVDTIINLPGHLHHHTNIPTCIIVTNKHHDHPGKIKFIDATSLILPSVNRRIVNLDVNQILALIESKSDGKNVQFIANDLIISNEYNLSMERYQSRPLETPNGYRAVQLANLLTQTGYNIEYPDVDVPVVKISTLSDNSLDPEIHPHLIKKEKPRKGYKYVACDALLVSSVRKLKPTFYRHTVEGIFIHSNIFAFTADTQIISYNYLIGELRKDYVLRQLNYRGSAQQFITVKDLLSIYIFIPDRREVQDDIVVHETQTLAKDKEQEFESQLAKTKQEYIELVRQRKHDMKTPMTQLRNSLTMLESCTKEPQQLKYLQKIRTALDVLSGIVGHLADEDDFSEAVVVNIEDYLLQQKTISGNYQITYFKDEQAMNEAGIKTAKVLIGSNEYKRLVNNIISNAVEHGFKNKEEKYELNINLSVQDNFFIIDFQNDGALIPENITKGTYGMQSKKGIDSDGDGRGGYIVKNILEHYGGDYDLSSVKDENGYNDTHIIVKLPIYRENE